VIYAVPIKGVPGPTGQLPGTKQPKFGVPPICIPPLIAIPAPICIGIIYPLSYL